MSKSLDATAAEIRATNKVKKVVGDFFAARLTVDELHALGVVDKPYGLAADMTLADQLVELMMRAAHAKKEERRKLAEARSPLIGERYCVTFARGVARALGVLTTLGEVKRDLASIDERSFQWASISKEDLHRAYMANAAPALALTTAHPGSRAGLFVIDLRDLRQFADRVDVLSVASIAARVNGAPRP